MPSLKVSYFNFAGAAEPIRLTLAYGGVDFEDNRFAREDWPGLKPTTPYGSVPTLHVDGVQYAQSNAILRYAGKLAGLYPEDPVAALKVDQIIDAMEDMTASIRTSMREPDAEKKMAMRKTIAEETLPTWLGYLEKHMEQESGFLAGATPSIADMKFVATVDMLKSGMLDGIPVDIVDKYTKLMEMVKKVKSHENILAYEAKLAK